MAAFPLAAPPRDVPFSLRVRVRLGGVLTGVGWMVLALGLVFAWAFVGNSELVTAGAFDAPLATSEGRVVDCRPSSYEVNGERVFEVEFEYQLGDRTCRGTSWTRQRRPDPGDAVTIEYVRGRPTIARIRGMATAPMPSAVGFVLVFPLAGAVLILIGIWHNGKRVRLLQHGQLAMGRRIARQPTNTRINGQRVYQVTFAFRDGANQERSAVVRSHRDEVTDGDEPLPLLYEPGTEQAISWQDLPGRPTTDRDGLLQPVGIVGLLPVLLPPTLIAIAASLVSPVL